METTARISFPHPLGGTVSSAIPEPFSMTPRIPEITWDPVKRWLRGKKPGTVKAYSSYSKRFFTEAKDLYGFNDAAGFLYWAWHQPNGIAVEEAMTEFAETQEETARPLVLSALKTLLETNGYKGLGKGLVKAYQGGSYIRGMTRPEIINTLSYLDDGMQKLFGLFSKDTGFRGQTTAAIRWHHIKEDYDAGRKFCHVHLERKFYIGKKSAGLAFIGPDSLELLGQMIREGRVQTTTEKCRTEDSDEKKWRCVCKPIFPFTYSAIVKAIRIAMTKAHLEERIQPTHGFRKFFKNALDHCDPPLDVDKKRQLQGHSIGVERAYTDQVESLRPLIERAYPQLSLSDDALSDIRYKALQDEIADLKAKNNSLLELRAEFEAIKATWLAEREIKISYQRPAIPGA